MLTIAATRRCLSATRRHRAVRHSASSIHILRARKCPQVIGGIAAPTKVGRCPAACHCKPERRLEHGISDDVAGGSRAPALLIVAVQSFGVSALARNDTEP